MYRGQHAESRHMPMAPVPKSDNAPLITRREQTCGVHGSVSLGPSSENRVRVLALSSLLYVPMPST